MKYRLLSAGLLSLALGAGLALQADAQQRTTTTTTTTATPAPVQVVEVTPLSGQVAQEDVSWPGAITKSLTMTPGAGQFSADHLRFGRQVAITLYNPNPYAMRFDTTQRTGKEFSWVVPANSQRTVAFRHWNPVSDEVRFLSYQDPSSLVVTQGSVTQPQTATAFVGPPVPTISQVQTTTETTAPAMTPIAPSRGTSAVRGFW